MDQGIRPPSITLRLADPDDYDPIIKVMDDWWGGRRMTIMMPKLFFTHFRDTSLIAVMDAERVGFLTGFLSCSYSDESYIHFVGVHPEFRKQGIGRALYQRFFRISEQNGRKVVRCVTSPINKSSIAFHQHMGFQIIPSKDEFEGVPVHRGYDGPGEDRVLFLINL
jgi:ribosomal protein S18 acetylase RimI-like enzyme